MRISEASRMANERSAEWKKLNRELKILHARQAAGGRLTPKEQERLRFLEETLGDAEEVKRHEVVEEEARGPTRTTAESGFATEVSEELLQKADDFQAEKAWDKDVQREPKAKAVKDSREGKATFKQKGLSPFAVDLSDDMKDLGLGEEQPEEEEEQPREVGLKRSFQVDLGDEEVPTAGKGGPANPFAIQLDDGLAARLDQEAEKASRVPDLIDRSHQAAGPAEDQPPLRATDVSPELEALLHREGGITAAEAADHSEGGRTTFEVEDEDPTGLDDKLLRAAVKEAEDRGLAGEDSATWHVDEEGREIEPPPEPSAFDSPPAPVATPPPPPAKPRPRFADGATDLGVMVLDDGQAPHFSSGETRARSAAEVARAERIAPGESQPSTIVADSPTVASAPAAAIPLGDGSPERPSRTPRFAEGTTQPGEVLVPEPSVEVPIPTLADAAKRAPAADAPAGLQAADALDEIPDFSDDAGDFGPLDEPGQEKAAKKKPSAEPDYDYQKAMHDDLGAVPEFEAEEQSSVRSPAAKPAPSELDAFWGLADDAPAPQAAEPAPRPQPTEVPFPEAEAAAPRVAAPQPRAARSQAAKGGARPLPALNLQAARVAVPPPPKPDPPRKAGKEPGPPEEPGDQGRALMNDLFASEDDAPAPAPARQPARPAAAKPAAGKPAAARSATAGGPAAAARPAAAGRPAAAARPAATVRPVTARPGAAGGRPNDLRGPRKATVHFKDGASKRGTINEISLDADWLRLEPAQPGECEAEELNALALKAIFLLLPPGLAYPPKAGSPVRLRMIDGRMLEGTSPDYHPQRKAFTLFPRQDQGNIERVIVFNDAVKNIWVE